MGSPGQDAPQNAKDGAAMTLDSFGLGIVTLLAIPAGVAVLVAIGLIIRLIIWLVYQAFKYVRNCKEVSQ